MTKRGHFRNSSCKSGRVLILMDGGNTMGEGLDPNQVITRGDGESPRVPRNAKERAYEKLRMPLWLLDSILVLLIIAAVVVVVIGMIRGNIPTG